MLMQNRVMQYVEYQTFMDVLGLGVGAPPAVSRFTRLSFARYPTLLRQTSARDRRTRRCAAWGV